jgi:transcriptional regulator with XRE-family HTH domain
MSEVIRPADLATMVPIMQHAVAMESIKLYVREHNLSLEQFGAQIGATRGYVSKLINGLARPSLELLRKMHQVTSIPLAQLLDEAIGK